jgi:hypothetical protein
MYEVNISYWKETINLYFKDTFYFDKMLIHSKMNP